MGGQTPSCSARESQAGAAQRIKREPHRLAPPLLHAILDASTRHRTAPPRQSSDSDAATSAVCTPALLSIARP